MEVLPVVEYVTKHYHCIYNKLNNFKTRQDKTRQLYLTRVAQSAAKLVSLGALGSSSSSLTSFR